MECHEIGLLPCVMAGAVLGGLVYLAAVRRKRVKLGPVGVEALFQGFGFAGALHLLYCVFCPHLLVELFNQQGQPLPQGVQVKIDVLHRVEFFIGSIVLLFVSLKAFRLIWDDPDHTRGHHGHATTGAAGDGREAHANATA